MVQFEDTIKFEKLRKTAEKRLGRELTKDELSDMENKVMGELFESVGIPEVEESDIEIQGLKDQVNMRRRVSETVKHLGCCLKNVQRHP